MPWRNFDYCHYLKMHRLHGAKIVFPLFEAIENAFQSVDDSKKNSAKVIVRIYRSTPRRELSFSSDEKHVGSAPDISQIEIIDEGLGFTNENWEAFETISTGHKRDRGGRGMGRLSYCIAFERVDFKSIYVEGDQRLRRKFSLSQVPQGSSECVIESAGTSEHIETIVQLKQPTADLRKHFPKSLQSIARQLAKEFFARLSAEKSTQLIIEDVWAEETIDVGDACRREYITDRVSSPLNIHGRKYTITHARVATTMSARHQVLMLGDGRTVTERDISDSLVFQRRPIETDGRKFFYAGFLEGEVLNKALHENRQGFDLPERHETPADGELPFSPDPDRPSIDEIANAVALSADDHLQVFAMPLKEAHQIRLRDFCHRNPAFRPLLKHRIDELNRIPIASDDVRFLESLSVIYYGWKSEVKSRFDGLISTARTNVGKLKERQQKYRESLAELNEMAVHELATYLTDRKVVIDYLWDRMKETESGKFENEDAIHDIFFPRKSSSNDVDWEDSQLWLIDERLMLQHYVASDLELRQHDPIESGSEGRPDVAVYHDTAFESAYAFAEGQHTHTAVTIIEFKKPERKRYTGSDNPVEQVFRYIDEIRSLKATRESGHRFRIGENTPIQVYIICHIVKELKRHISRYNYVETQDGQGLFFHSLHERAFVQIVTFEKLIQDAKHRHEAFFRKLGFEDP